MTVLVIIGLMSSAVILTMPDKKPAVLTFADDFHRDINRAAQTSLLSGHPTALGVSDEAYSFLKYENENWTAVQEGRWPGGAFVTFEKDKTPIKLTEDIIPLAVFEPTGQATVFSLKLADVDQGYMFTSMGDGKVTKEALQ